MITADNNKRSLQNARNQKGMHILNNPSKGKGTSFNKHLKILNNREKPHIENDQNIKSAEPNKGRISDDFSGANQPTN